MGHCFESKKLECQGTFSASPPDPPACPSPTSLLSSVTQPHPGASSPVSCSCRFLRPGSAGIFPFFCRSFTTLSRLPPPPKNGWSWGQEWLVNTLRQGSSSGTRDPCKNPEGGTSLCSPKQFPRGLKFSFKSPFPVLLTSLWGRKMAPAGSSSWGSRRPGLAWALTAGSLPRGQATISC